MKKIKKRKLSSKSQKKTSQNHPYTVSPLALPFFSIIFDINYSPFKTQSKRQRLSNISTPQSTSLQTRGRTRLLSIASAILCQDQTSPGPVQTEEEGSIVSGLDIKVIIWTIKLSSNRDKLSKRYPVTGQLQQTHRKAFVNVQ